MKLLVEVEYVIEQCEDLENANYLEFFGDFKVRMFQIKEKFKIPMNCWNSVVGHLCSKYSTISVILKLVLIFLFHTTSKNRYLGLKFN